MASKSKGSKKRDIHSLEAALFEQVEEAKKKEKKAKSTKPPLKKRKLQEDSDDYSSESSSDVEDDVIMEDFEEEEEEEPVPMEVDASSSSEDEPFDDGYDDELYKDEEDRRRLMAMTEREREEILSERYAQRKELRERYEQKQRLKAERRKQKAQQPRQPSTRTKRATTTAKKEKTDEAMAKLKEQRRARGEKEDGPTTTKLSSRLSRDSEKDKAAPAPPTAATRQGEPPAPKQAAPAPVVEPLTIELADLNKIRLSRQQLEEFVDMPFFDTMIPGFFVRVAIGLRDNRQIYRIAEVVEVQERDVRHKYSLGKKEVIKVLLLRIGASTKEWRMDYISNGAFQQDEWDQWVKDMRRHAGEARDRRVVFPTAESVAKKVKDLDYMKNYKCTPEDIEKMVAYKKKLQTKPRNIAKERAQLVLEKEAALEAGNQEEVQRITKRIEELDELALKETSVQKESLVAKINKKNKSANFEASMSQKVSDNPFEQEENDPFSRRWTKPDILWVATDKLVDDKEKGQDKQNGTPAPPKQKEKRPKEKKPLVSRIVVDTTETLVKAHDFDLDIDIKDTTAEASASAAASPLDTLPKTPGVATPAPAPHTAPSTAASDSGTKVKTLSLQEYFQKRQQLEAA